jgi:hypothetical protein
MKEGDGFSDLSDQNNYVTHFNLQATHLKLLIGQVAGDFFEEAFEGWS